MSSPHHDDHAALEHRVLQLVGQLVGEVRPGSAAAGIGPDDTLERDLGLGSLERIELVSRVERQLGVRLSDATIASVESPRDLARAIRTAEPALDESRPRIVTPLDLATPAPDDAETLVDVLRWHAREHPERTHIFLREEDGSELPITYGQLWRRSVRVAHALGRRGIGRRDTVTLMLRTEPAFFPAFFGTLLAGAVPVPIYPPFRPDRIAEYAERQVGILSNAGTRLMITFAEVERLASLLRGRIPTLSDVTTLDDLCPDLDEAGGELPAAPPISLAADDPALIQYTSGSTGQPKGVLLTHGNLLANVRAIGEGLEIQPDDVVVSWLPLYHDMGLIGAWLGTLYFAIPVAILSPLTFLARPARWFWAIQAHRATVAVGPNFAFDLAANKITDEEIDGVDLGSIRLMLNGSEAVLPATLERFTRRFTGVGLRPDVMRPVYGLAECSVGLTVTPQRQPPRVDRIARTFRQDGRAEPSETADALAFVACGLPLPRHEIRIANPSGALLEERWEGRVQFRGPSMMSGYYRNPEATAAITTDDGWIDSGDLGYLADGELFLTGRHKDVIIKAGRNVYPHEAEAIVAGIDGVRKGCVAVFGVADEEAGTEQLVVVAETRASDPGTRENLHQRVLDQVTTALGLPPDVVVLARPGAVLKTSSGKIRRAATRDAYLTGRLDGGTGSMARQWVRLAWGAVAGRLAQAAALAGSIVYTGYILALLLVTVPVVWALVAASGSVSTARDWLKRAARWVVAVSGCRLEVRGLAHLDNLEPAIFVANHASFLDVVVILATLPVDVRFAAKGRLTTYPVLSTIIPKAGYIAIDKSAHTEQMEGADEVSSALGAGESMFVFPEGTFVRAPGLLPFRLGAFRAAVSAGRPVVSIALAGTRDIFPADTILLRPGTVTLTVHPPQAPTADNFEEVVRLRDDARRRISRVVGEQAG